MPPPKKTGGNNTEWVVYDSPKPPPVDDHYKYWGDAPPELSERCQWWVRQIENGWQPNRRWASECYDCSAELYGIYIWEFTEVICPALHNGRFADLPEKSGNWREEYINSIDDPIKRYIVEKLFEELDWESDAQILWGDGS